MPLRALRVSVYINEADTWKERPLHLEILRMLQEHRLSGATVLQAIAGFTGRGGTRTSSPDSSGKPPLVVDRKSVV